MSRLAFLAIPIAGLLLVLGCSAPPEPVSLPVPFELQPLDLSAYTLVDLSHAYDEYTLYWPTSTERFDMRYVLLFKIRRCSFFSDQPAS